MRSKVHIKSHPLHPILVAFPIAFFVGTFLFDLFFLWWNDNGFFMTAKYLNIAGIIGALAAAIPGVIDFFGVVPPKSSAKKRAAKHGLLNVLNLVIFILAYYYRLSDNFNLYLLLGMEMVGLIVLTIAGFMGGTLVYRNQIGVDHRYAGAAKWNEEYFNTEKQTIEVAKKGELSLNAMKLLHINGKRIALTLTEKGYAAFDDHCSHKGGPLSDGVVLCGTVHCPWHGSHFDVFTGDVKSGPAKVKINTYKVSEVNGKIILSL